MKVYRDPKHDKHVKILVGLLLGRGTTQDKLGGGFKDFFIFTSIPEKRSKLTNIFSNGLVQPPTSQMNYPP